MPVPMATSSQLMPFAAAVKSHETLHSLDPAHRSVRCSAGYRAQTVLLAAQASDGQRSSSSRLESQRPLSEHASQTPSHALSQQRPETQNPEAHPSSTAHSAPSSAKPGELASGVAEEPGSASVAASPGANPSRSSSRPELEVDALDPKSRPVSQELAANAAANVMTRPLRMKRPELARPTALAVRRAPSPRWITVTSHFSRVHRPRDVRPAIAL